MAPPSWAYQVENFDPPPDDELVCSVCRSVFCDPIQSPCNHVFCRGCLFKWLENNRTCPICRKRTFKASVQEVVPLVKNMIMKLTLRCRNWENHCREKFALEACEAHMKVCAFEMIMCKNRPCKMMFLRKDMKEHDLNCLHRTVRCQKCYLKVPTKERGHDCIAALKQKVKAREEDLKKKNKKIKELESELSKLRNIQAISSDISSLGDVSAADILIDLEDMQSLSSSSSASDSSSPYDSESYETRWFDFLDDSSRSNSLGNFYEDYSHDRSSEFPRAAASEAANESSFLGTDGSVSLEEEPMARRPAKRRHPVPAADTSDEEDNNDQGLPSLPSPKRTWNNFPRRENEASRQGASGQNDQAFDCVAGPSHSRELRGQDVVRSMKTALSQMYNSLEEEQRSSASRKPRLDATDKSEGATGSGEAASYAAAELSGSDSDTVNKSKDRLRHRKRLFKDLVSAPASDSVSGTRTSPAFERTLAMLEQYNLESEDDDWRPGQVEVREDSSESDAESDSSQRTAPSSYYDSSASDCSVEVTSRKDWFTRLFEVEPESDPDWSPE